MVDSAIVFTYTRPHPGREIAAYEAFEDGLTFFGKLAADGKCLEPEVFSGPFGKGAFVIKGELVYLREILDSDDFKRFYLKATFSVPDIGFEIYAFGEGVTDWMDLWSTIGKELTYM